MSNYKLRRTEEKEGFTIKLYTMPEEDQPDWDFESGEAKQQLLEDINNGIYEYFIAKVTAEKRGIKLAKNYLGGCCYKSMKEFTQPGTYYDVMVQQVILDARKTLASLCD